MLKPIALLVSIIVGGTLGWHIGSPLGLIGSYMIGVVGSSIGLYIGRRIQQNLGDD